MTEITFGALISQVPYIFGFDRCWSAVGKSKSDNDAGLGGATLGRKKLPNTVVTVNNNNANQNGIINLDYSNHS